MNDIARARAEGNVDAPGYFIAGDAIRGFACVIVMAFHAILGTFQTEAELGVHISANPVREYWLGNIFRPAASMVPIFFALSGYLVGGPFMRFWRSGRALDLRRYFDRRARRILPAFLIITFLSWLRFGDYGVGTGWLLGVFGLVQVFGPKPQSGLMPQAWTLDVELMFYAVLPLAALLVGTRLKNRKHQLGITLAVLGVLSFAFRPGAPPGEIYRLSVLGQMWAFVPGMLMALYEQELRVWVKQHQRLARNLGRYSILAAFALYVALCIYHPSDGELVDELTHIPFVLAFVPGALIHQWAVGDAPGWVHTRVAHAFGRWSFSVYLLHVAVGREIRAHLPDGLHGNWLYIYVLVGMLTISFVGAAFMWHYIEEPALTGRRPVWRPWRRRAPATT